MGTRRHIECETSQATASQETLTQVVRLSQMAHELPAAASYGTRPLHGKGSNLAHVILSARLHFQAVSLHKPCGGHEQDKNSKVDRRTAMIEITGGYFPEKGSRPHRVRSRGRGVHILSRLQGPRGRPAPQTQPPRALPGLCSRSCCQDQPPNVPRKESTRIRSLRLTGASCAGSKATSLAPRM